MQDAAQDLMPRRVLLWWVFFHGRITDTTSPLLQQQELSPLQQSRVGAGQFSVLLFFQPATAAGIVLQQHRTSHSPNLFWL